MPAWITPLEWPVWWNPTSSSFSSTATRRSGARRVSSRAAARPRIPAPTTATSHWFGGGSPLIAGATLVGSRLGPGPCSTLGRRSAAYRARTPQGMSVRVRDLEIALVLAREMKAAAERSVDASLRVYQLQEVFGVQELDRTERALIQTALQMAGLEPFPSLLEAEPSEPIRFGASKTAVAASGGPPTSPPPPPATPPAAEGPTEAETQPAFPTVGEFARSKLRARRFGVRRGDHGEDEAPPPPEPAAPHEAPAEANGHLPDEPVMEDEIVEDQPLAEEEDELYDEPEPLPEAEPEPEPEPEQREYIPLAPEEPVAYEEPEPEPL